MTKKGRYTQGQPFHTGRGSYYRYDTYHSTDAPDLDGLRDFVACTGKADTSPIYTGHYNSQCHCCWLNHGHSEAYHQKYTQKEDTDGAHA